MDTIDPQVKNLVTAIGRAETGGEKDPYNTKGASGEFGRYQFMPNTWKMWAKEQLGDENAPMSVENQNKVAYNKVKAWKDQGLNPAQIASKWNSGDENLYKTGGVGVNKMGVPYDVPAYVKKVSKHYMDLKGTVPPPIIDNGSVTQEQPKELGIIAQSGDQFAKGYRQTVEGVNNPDMVDGLQQIGKGVLNEAAGGIRAAFSPIEWGLTKAKNLIEKIPAVKKMFGEVDNGVQLLADKISENPQLQKFMENNPEADEVVGNLITIGGAVVGGGKSKVVREGMAPLTDAVTDIVGRPIRNSLETKYIKSTVDDWNRIGGDYVKTNKILQQGEKVGKDTPQFLSEMGIHPSELIEDGKFAKANDVANKLTKESVKPYEDILTQQLKVAQQGQPFVDVGEIHSAIVKKIKSLPGLIAGDEETMISSATREMRLLYKKYPKGIPLDKLNEVKGNYWRATNFDLNRPLQPQVNYNIGRTMREIIEEKIPDASIQELNGLLGDYYAAGKFLRGLADKKPKLTTGQKLRNTAIKGAAMVGGESLMGFKGGVAGYLLGKSITHILENASNPLKAWILANMEKTNPAVYSKAIEWLGQQESARLSRLLLPEGDPSKVPIEMGAPARKDIPVDKIGNDFTHDSNRRINTKYLPAPEPRTIVPNKEGTPNIAPDPGIGGLRQRITE